MEGQAGVLTWSHVPPLPPPPTHTLRVVLSIQPDPSASASQNEGHPDIRYYEPDEAKSWGFAGPITTFDQLLYVLTTIAWIKTGLHSAVNFLQWDYSSVGLNTPCAMSRRIPRPTDTEAVKVGARGRW